MLEPGRVPPPPNRSQRRRARTRAALLAAARDVFAARGPEAATIQQITDAADVAKGSFYNHFSSREEILAAVARDSLEALGAALDREIQQREPDPARVIARSLLCTLRTCARDPALGGFLLASPDLLEVGDPIRARGLRDVERGRESGRFALDDAETVLTLVSGGAQSWLRRRLRGELDAAADVGFVALALRALGLSRDEADAIAAEADAAAPDAPAPEPRGG